MTRLLSHPGQNFWPAIFDDKLFGDFFAPYESRLNEWSSRPTFLAPVDIHETPHSYQLQMDLPGVKRETVKIALDNGVLTVSGERREEQAVTDSKCHRRERYTGEFKRSFSLGDAVDSEKILAKLNDGVLELTLQKKEESKPREIRIS